jgi:formate hydrogenlyase subunit 3/multisubunit Na+/H+ antiporter MnhD subunit
MSNYLAKYLIIIGMIITLIGVFFFFKESFPFLKHLGKLPGDISIKNDNFSFYFPITTSIIISIILSLIFFIINKMK